VQTPLSITLVWTDRPGLPLAATALVNDLDLQVYSPSGPVGLGNSGDPLATGQTGDTVNNVERVVYSNPNSTLSFSTGARLTLAYRVHVRANALPFVSGWYA